MNRSLNQECKWKKLEGKLIGFRRKKSVYEK